MTIASRKSPAGFVWTEERWGAGLRAAQLSEIADHLFTTRDLPLDSDHGAWDDVARAVGAETLVRLRQVHGADVVVIRRGMHEASRRTRMHADILISDDASTAIAVQAADCVPLLMADPATGAVAAAHAGWRGMCARVPQRAVAALVEAFGCRAEDLVAAAGPSIGPCCYEVGPELDEAFRGYGFDDRQRRRWFSSRASNVTGKLTLDLWTTVVDQLIDSGVRASNISVARLCTVDERDQFPSYRRDGPTAGRLAGAIRSAAFSRQSDR